VWRTAFVKRLPVAEGCGEVKDAEERIDVVSATPLRKQPASRRDDIKRPKEFEPEVYAEAALKYLNR
jgi:hypothetical protein